MSPLPVLYMGTQNYFIDNLLFAVGNNEGNSIQRLSRFIRCRDIFISTLNYIDIKEVYEEVGDFTNVSSPVLLIADDSFGYKQARCLLESSHVYNKYASLFVKNTTLNIHFIDLLEQAPLPFKVCYAAPTKIYWEFPFLMSYYTLLLRTFSKNSSYKSSDAFIKGISTAGTEDGIYWEQLLSPRYTKIIEKLNYLLNNGKEAQLKSLLSTHGIYRRGIIDTLHLLRMYPKSNEAFMAL